MYDEPDLFYLNIFKSMEILALHVQKVLNNPVLVLPL